MNHSIRTVAPHITKLEKAVELEEKKKKKNLPPLLWHYEFFKKQAFPNVDRLTGYTFLLVVYFDQLLGAAHTQKLAETLFGGGFQPLFDDE